MSAKRAWFLDATLATALCMLCALIAAQANDGAREREAIRVASVEARNLHAGFARFHEKHHSFPDALVPSASGTEVLELLRRRGYYSGDVERLIVSKRVDAYDAPRDGAGAAEYWIEMTLSADASIRLLVARSDDAPLSRGRWADGAFLYRDGKLEAL
jgi:hypothetical protein